MAFEVQDATHQKVTQLIEIVINKSAPVVADMCKAMAEWLAQNGDTSFATGKQSLQNLMASGDKLSTLPLDSRNLRSFQKIARKYGINYSLEKDLTKDPPQHKLTYRAKDTDTMMSAFKEYLNTTLAKQKGKKPTYQQRMKNAKDRMNSQTLDTEKNNRRGAHEL